MPIFGVSRLVMVPRFAWHSRASDIRHNGFTITMLDNVCDPKGTIPVPLTLTPPSPGGSAEIFWGVKTL